MRHSGSGSGVLGTTGAEKELPVVDNDAQVLLSGSVSTNNSSTTPLAGGASFTGTAEEVTSFTTCRVYVFSNVASAANGLKLQSSTDGTNWDKEITHTVTAGTAYVLHTSPLAKYFRVVYTNGASAQASFRLQTIFQRHPSTGVILSIGETLNDTRLAQIVRSILAAKKPNGDYVNIAATAGGNLKAAIEEFDPAAWLDQLTSSTSTLSNVAASASSVSLLAANAARKGATFYNDSTAIAYVKLGTTASATSYTVQMDPRSFYMLEGIPVYTGRVDAIWASATGDMRITELT